MREATAGLWRNNMTLAQLLGLCPLLAVSTSLVNGLALGVLTTLVLVIANPAMSLMRRVLVPAARIPLYLLLVTALVTSLDMLTHAVLVDLHETLGLFIPLIVVNCGLLAHAETVASRRSVVFVAVSAMATGFGFMFALMALGALREVLGHGTLLAGTGLLRGEDGSGSGLQLPFDGMLVAVLPPGAFFGMGLLLALRNRLLAGSSAKAQAAAPALPEAPR
ncbi:MAG TPA: electron transport complex subunit RsxE [Gammaproteobacteria bacterium]|nr:electron transport complex subunit RsxE [Gammaproteobacteria bacterium]